MKEPILLKDAIAVNCEKGIILGLMSLLVIILLPIVMEISCFLFCLEDGFKYYQFHALFFHSLSYSYLCEY